MPEAVPPVEDSGYYNPESHALHLPSELISSRTLSPTGEILANMEAKLRFAQATDALSQCCILMRTSSEPEPNRGFSERFRTSLDKVQNLVRIHFPRI